MRTARPDDHHLFHVRRRDEHACRITLGPSFSGGPTRKYDLHVLEQLIIAIAVPVSIGSFLASSTADRLSRRAIPVKSPALEKLSIKDPC